MTTPDTVSNDLSVAEKLLDKARLAMSEGRDFDLIEFNDALSSACQGVIGMPPEKISSVRAALKGLLTKLDDFKRELEHGMAQDTAASGSRGD